MGKNRQHESTVYSTGFLIFCLNDKPYHACNEKFTVFFVMMEDVGELMKAGFVKGDREAQGSAK